MLPTSHRRLNSLVQSQTDFDSALPARRGRPRAGSSERFTCSERLARNRAMGPAEIREYCLLDDAGKGMLLDSVEI